MPRPCRRLRLTVLLAGVSAAGAPLPAPAELPDYLALALPVSGITVDGDLSDWPREMPALPIRNEFGAYGPTDTEGTDLDTSEDLSPSFRVGYDPREQLLYVAVEVRDDVLHTSLIRGDVSRTDACEIYVSGLVSSDHTPIQYALVPGSSTYTSFDRRGVHRNLRDDRRSRGAWRRLQRAPGPGGQGRRENLTVYEWGVQVRSALPAYPWTNPRDGYSAMNPAPGRAVRLEGGRMIGFDVVVVDGDGPLPGSGPPHRHSFSLPEEATASWVPWGPPRSIKMYGDDRVGRLVLAPEDWSAGFDLEAMEEYLATWLRDHPDDWISAIERAAAGQPRPHSHLLARRLDQAALPVAPAGAWQGSHPDVPAHGPEAWDGRLLLAGGCLLGLALGLAGVLLVRRRPGADSAALGERLAALESRMTDTQDVMIALSEKVDRMDARDRRADEPAPPG